MSPPPPPAMCIWNRPFLLLIFFCHFNLQSPRLGAKRVKKRVFFSFPFQQYNLLSLHFWLSSPLFCLLKPPLRETLILQLNKRRPRDQRGSSLLMAPWLKARELGLTFLSFSTTFCFPRPSKYQPRVPEKGLRLETNRTADYVRAFWQAEAW